MNILEEVKRLKFPSNQYIVVGGAVLAMHGIRDTEDLDILMTPGLFEKCRGEGWKVNPWTKPGKKGKDWLKKDSVEGYLEILMMGDNLTIKELSQDVEVIEGVPCISLIRLLEFKKEYFHLYSRPSSIPFLVFGDVSYRNHTEIDPILSMGAGIELTKLCVYTSS